jgi:hypothetical protein
MNRNKGAQMEAARQRKAERQTERGQTKAYLWSWRPGDRVRTPDGETYMVVSADADRTVVLQKLVLDSAKKPISGLRERALIRAVAGRDRVQLGGGTWARRIPPEAVCAG